MSRENLSKTPANRSHPLPTSHLTPAPAGLSSPPIILLLAGALSPITHMHLRLLELARHQFTRHGRHVLGGYISPVADAYNKPDLIPAHHRLEMVSLALSDADWIALDPWEALQGRFVRTYEVMRRLKDMAKACGWGEVEIYLVVGGDLLENMGDENIWPNDSIKNLFDVGCVAWVAREGKGAAVLSKGGKMERWAERCVQVEGWVWPLSSKLVRSSVRQGQSIMYMTPTAVVKYIQKHRLFL